MKIIQVSIMLFFIFSSSIIIGQGLVDIKNTSTCETAYDITRFKQFGPTTAPLKIGVSSENTFIRPQYPTWYKFTIQQDGILLFDIMPTKPTDNYDFLLFKDDGSFCKKYNNNLAKSIRSNFTAPDYFFHLCIYRPIAK